jgi:hypothetical protein
MLIVNLSSAYSTSVTLLPSTMITSSSNSFGACMLHLAAWSRHLQLPQHPPKCPFTRMHCTNGPLPLFLAHCAQVSPSNPTIISRRTTYISIITYHDSGSWWHLHRTGGCGPCPGRFCCHTPRCCEQAFPRGPSASPIILRRRTTYIRSITYIGTQTLDDVIHIFVTGEDGNRRTTVMGGLFGADDKIHFLDFVSWIEPWTFRYRVYRLTVVPQRLWVIGYTFFNIIRLPRNNCTIILRY